jgi:hypothetical protein
MSRFPTLTLPTSFFRNVYADLVERRLLPLAALLVLALVAVPLVLAKSMPNAPFASAAPAPHTSIPSSEAAVSLMSPDGDKSRLNGLKANNPFLQRKVARRAAPTVHAASGATGAGPATASSSGSTSSSTGSSSPSPASSTSSSGGSSSGASSPSPSSSSPSSGASHKAVTPVKHAGEATRYRVPVAVLRFGRAGHRGARSSLDSLSSLPRGHTPVVVYVGMLGDGKTAEFLVASHVKAQGDGSCRPSSRSCRTVRLRAGQIEFFDAPGPRGTTVQYELDMGRVGHRWTTSLSDALHAFA